MATKPPGKEKFKAPLKGTPKHTSPPSSRVLYLIMALVAVVILVGGYLFYRDQAQQMHQRIEGGLSIVAQLKADQIAEWRTERLTDADMLVGSPFFAEGVEKYLASPTDTEAKDKVLARLAVIKKAYPYQDMLLTDVNGKVLLSLNDSVPRLSDITLAQLPVAIKERKAVMVDFHYPPDSNFPHLDVVAPLFPWGQDSPQAIGAVVFCIDPSQYLYPLLQSSPMPSETAETLLVERDGDQVLFLNELRHQKDTALKLRIPLSQQEVPAVMAVLGKEGVVEGKDYRGVEVLSALKHIPDSPWYMVAKIDTSEAISAGRFRTGMTMALVAGLLAAALAVAGLIWQRRRRLVYQALYQAEIEAQALRGHFEYLVKYANDIIYLTDENYHIVEVNDRALETYGYTRQEMLGMPLAALISPGDLSSYQARLRKIQQKGTIVAEGVHQRKDGSTFPVELSGRTIKIEDKTYLQGIVRDITERKQAEGEVQEERRKLKEAQTMGKIGNWEYDVDSQTIIWSDEAYVLYERDPALGPPNAEEEAKYYSADQARTLRDYAARSIENGEEFRYDLEAILPSGKRPAFAASMSPIINESGRVIKLFGTVQDITERKQAEEALRESEKKYRLLADNAIDIIWTMDMNLRFTYMSPSVARVRGYTVEEVMAQSLEEVFTPSSVEVAVKVFMEELAIESREPKDLFRVRTLEVEHTCKDGSTVWFEINASFIRDADGQPVGILGVSREITERRKSEEALRRSEERYRTIMEEIENSYFELDLSGNLTFVNDATCRHLGYFREELVGMNYRVCTPPENFKVVSQTYNQVYRTGEPVKCFPRELIRKDGSRMSSETSVFPLRNTRGEIIGFRGVGRDVTERKQAEEKYQTIVRTTIDGFWLTDMQGHFLDVNDAYCHLTGYSHDELLNMAITDVEAIEEPEETAKRIRKIKEVGYDRFETRHRRKDGEIIDVGISVNYLPIDGGRMFVFIRDISERKRAEEVQRRSEERYRTIVEEMDESYYEVDLAGNMTFVNDATCRRLGRSREELIGMKYKAYTPAEDTETVFKIYNRVYRAGEPVKGVPAVAIAKDGSLRFVERSVFPLRDEEGKIIGFRGISRDVTEHKMAEEERRQLELKAQITSRLASVGEMAAGVAHEINNPLTAVTGYAQLLVDREDVPSDIRSDLAAINDGARRVAGIVRTLLAFSRQTKPQRKLVDINELIESTLVLRAYHLRVNNIEVVTRLVPDLLETVVDPGQIQQVLLNLIVNAETEMKLAHGKGKLTITTKKSDNTIKICCQDNGPGIKPEVMDKIFDPFFTTREVGEGTGLGLSLCYGIVTEHKGKIYAESKPGKGATFIIELPIVTEVTPPKPAESDAKKPEKVVKARILVVDDEQVVRDVVNRVLTGEGHKVDAVDNAVDALKKIESKRYKLILVDIKMPGMNGVELYKRIKKIAEPLARKVVFITGDVMGADTEKFLSETKIAHIGKPFNAGQLSREVQRALTAGR